MNIATIEVSGTYARIGRYVTIPAGIVGATVDFRFTDDLWAGLQKPVVFRSSVTRDVLLDGTVAVIPHETVAKPGDTLYVGVYGVDAEKKSGDPHPLDRRRRRSRCCRSFRRSGDGPHASHLGSAG